MLASDPEHYGGGVTADAAEKTARFVDMCDQFRLPVVNFVDVPGFVIGTDAERAGTIRRGARGLYAVVQASVPWVSILVRKVYGVAGAGHGDGSRLNLRYAWPSGNWGSLPMAGGLEAAYRRELEAADDPEALRAEIAARLEAVTSPFRTAERFSVEEIIDPRDTRPILCDWAERAHEIVQHELGDDPKHAASGPEPVQYRGVPEAAGIIGRCHGGEAHRGWTEAHVRRLFWRAGFGATPREARHWARRGKARHDPLAAERRPLPRSAHQARRAWTGTGSTPRTSGATTCSGGSTGWSARGTRCRRS